MAGRIAAPGLVAGSLLVAGAPVSAELDRWTDEDGRIHFTSDRDKVPARYRAQADQPTGGGKSTINRVESPGRSQGSWERAMPTPRPRSTTAGSPPARRMDAFAEKPVPKAKPSPQKYTRDCTGNRARCRSWVNPEWKRWKKEEDARKRILDERDDF